MHIYKIELKKDKQTLTYYIEKADQVFAAVYNIFNEFKDIEKFGTYPDIYFYAVDKLLDRCRLELKIFRISTLVPRRIGEYYKPEWQLFPACESGADDDKGISRDIYNYFNTLDKERLGIVDKDELYYVYCIKEDKWLQYAARGFGNVWTKDKENANKFNKASLAHIEAYFKEYEFKEEIVFVKV